MILIGDSGLLASVEGLEDYEHDEGYAPPWLSVVDHCRRKGCFRPAAKAKAAYNAKNPETVLASNHGQMHPQVRMTCGL